MLHTVNHSSQSKTFNKINNVSACVMNLRREYRFAKPSYSYSFAGPHSDSGPESDLKYILHSIAKFLLNQRNVNNNLICTVQKSLIYNKHMALFLTIYLTEKLNVLMKNCDI